MKTLNGLVAVLFAVCLATTATAQPPAEATELVDVWVEAVMSGDPDRLDDILAPEFQIQRADDTAHGKADYIAGHLD